MKKILSIILSLILTFSLFGGTFSVSAASSSFETDFSSFTSTECFKKIYDSEGKEVVGKFAFSKTADGLRYKREANEIFYNPSGGDRTTLGGHKAFPVSKTGKGSNAIYEVTANTCYKIELTYNCTVLSQGATIVLTAAFSQGGNADVATNGKSANIKTTVEIGSNKYATIDKTGSATIVGYFTTGELAKEGSSVYNRLYVLLGSTDRSDVDITLTYLKVTPMSKIIVHDVNSGVDTYYYGASGETFSLTDETTAENYIYNSKSLYSKRSTTLYYDEQLKNVVNDAAFANENVTYYVANENVTVENQMAFCGFDTYTLRTHQGNVGFKTMEDAISENAQISNEAAYTGEKSLKVNVAAKSESVVYIGSGYEMSAGATYRLSLHYRAVEKNDNSSVTFCFTSGNGKNSVLYDENLSNNILYVSADQINGSTQWKTATLYYTPAMDCNKADLAPVLCIETDGAAGIFVDSLIISKAVSAEGTSILKEEADGQALRFYFSYDVNNEKLVTDIQKSEIAKRGILYGAEEKIKDNALLTLEESDKNPNVYKKELTLFSSCWDFDNDSGKTTFSAYLKDISKKYYGKKLSVRGYVVLTDGSVFYSEIISESVDSVMEKNNSKDMYYKLSKSSSGDYKNIMIYIPTSDISGKYYIAYNLQYTLSAQPDDMTVANKANTGYNQETYRIMAADLVEKTGDTFTKKVENILHAGELELAIRENRSGVNDFIGGYHGDEIMNYAKLYVDGEQIVINGEEKGITPCRNITFETDTVMYRCASGTKENPKGTAVCNHYLFYEINSKTGFSITQKVEWLVNDFKNDVPMVCMFTVGRYSGTQKITDTIEYYKWDGSYIDTMDATNYGRTDETSLYSSYNGPAYAVAYSKNSGFKATVGYKNVRGLTDTFQNYVWVRPYGDNKIYFKANANRTNQIGEVWEWVNYFNFDYVEK